MYVGNYIFLSPRLPYFIHVYNIFLFLFIKLCLLNNSEHGIATLYTALNDQLQSEIERLKLL